MDQQKWQMMKEKFCEQVDEELEKISKMPSLTDVALRNLNDLTDTKKNLLKIDILTQQLNGGMYEGGNSFGRMYNQGNSNGYMMGNSNRYIEPMYGNSYGGNSYGGNSYGNSDAYSHLEQAMRAARTEDEREAIRQAMSHIHM